MHYAGLTSQGTPPGTQYLLNYNEKGQFSMTCLWVKNIITVG